MALVSMKMKGALNSMSRKVGVRVQGRQVGVEGGRVQPDSGGLSHTDLAVHVGWTLRRVSKHCPRHCAVAVTEEAGNGTNRQQ